MYKQNRIVWIIGCWLYVWFFWKTSCINWKAKMLIRAKERPKMIARYDNSVIINWENIFDYTSISNSDSKTYILQLYDNLSDWNTIYRYGFDLALVKVCEDSLDKSWNKIKPYLIEAVSSGSRAQCECKQLAPNTSYKCQLKVIIRRADASVDNESASDWVIFHIATSSDQFYVMHLTRAVTFEKTALIRKITNHSPVLLDAVSASNQQTQLYAAVHRSHLAMVQFLLNIGANVNGPQTLTLRTPLMLAVFLGNQSVLGILLEKKPDLKLVDVNKMNVLHYAVDGGHEEAVRQILNLGLIDVNNADNKGWTALFRAVIMGANNEIIFKLLRSGANIDLKDKNGYSLQDHCKMVNRIELYNSIKDFQHAKPVSEIEEVKNLTAEEIEKNS